MTDDPFAITTRNTRFDQCPQQQWSAFTSFPLDPEHPTRARIVFRTAKEATGIVTRCKVLTERTDKTYERELARHIGQRATRANIEDAHLAAGFEFADQVRYARAVFWT